MLDPRGDSAQPAGVSHSESLFASCTPGLESALFEECVELGFEAKAVTGGVELAGPAGLHARANLWLRTASRVLLRVAVVQRDRELERVSLVPFFGRDAAVRLHVSGEEGTREAQAALQRRLRLVAAGKGDEDGRTSTGSVRTEGNEPFDLFLRGEKGRLTLSVDTSGELLHFRGYRQEVGKAPLRETLAAGVLRLAGWTPGTPLWDVMCGSGTFLIEAAEWAQGLAPGRNRRFAFERFASHDAPAFASLPRTRPAAPASPFLGSDLNAGALGVARRNARRAGVLDALTLERLDATKLAPRPNVAPGLVLANLPYGRRVAEKSELAGLYRAVGRALCRATPGWRFAFLLEEGALLLGLPIETDASVANGGLHCHVVSGHLPKTG